MKMTRRHMTSAGAAAAAATVLMAAASRSQAGGPEIGAVDAPNQFVEVGGRKLAYRSVGEGKPIVLLNRFRGTLDTWDPAFIDALAAEGFQVLYFDYSGLGLSTGEKSYNPANLARDAREFILALGLKDVAIGGWSIGGIAAQIYLAMFGSEVSHAILLATTPPGQLVKPGRNFSTSWRPSRKERWSSLPRSSTNRMTKAAGLPHSSPFSASASARRTAALMLMPPGAFHRLAQSRATLSSRPRMS